MHGILPQIEYKRVPVYDLHVACYVNRRERIVTGDHDALQIEVSNHVGTHKEGRLARCEESANILSVSIASALSGQ
jgi:hypothetical protein